MPLHKTSFAFAFASVCMAWPQPSQAEVKPEPPGEATRLREITISATRTERRVDDVPNTVTVKPATEIEASGARDLKDLLRNELDVTVRAAPARFTAAGASTGRAGNEGINVRGLEGNQVLMLVDGIRVPNGFSFGAFASGRADFFDIDTLKTVEVLRGPASTQYGSDGLAGAVSLTTLSPEDLLKNGKTFAGFARLGIVSVVHSWHTSVAAASAAGPWKSLLMLTHRAGHETRRRLQPAPARGPHRVGLAGAQTHERRPRALAGALRCRRPDDRDAVRRAQARAGRAMRVARSARDAGA
jgi:hemoglobin/transferrin/lactoferrin receptor protein